jgi:hypothetical protein
MRIAAGVLLIIAAVFNVMAGAGYALAGAVGEVGADAINAAAAASDAAEGTEGIKIDTAEVNKAMGDLAGMSSGLKYFGFFLLALFVLQIVGGIFCFIRKSAMFIMVIAVLSIGAEVGGIVLTAFGWTNTIGLVAGVLAFLTAMGLKKGDGAAPAAPAA